MDIVVSRFIIEKKPIYLRTVWNVKEGGNSFELTLSDGKHVWYGKAEEEYLEKKLKPQGMPSAEYMSLVRQALTVQDVTQKQFSYSITHASTPGDLEFAWKIKLGEDGELTFHVKGSLVLKRIAKGEQSSLQQYLDWLIDRATALEKDNKELRAKNTQLQTLKDDALAKFEKLINDKKNLETDLYSKFALVLNEKKKKIKELKEELESMPAMPESSRSSRHSESGAESSGEEDDDNETPVSDYVSLSQSQGLTPTPSLTFNNLDPTPSHELLTLDDAYKVRATVRKRHRVVQEESASSSLSSASQQQTPSMKASQHSASQQQLNVSKLEEQKRKLEAEKKQEVAKNQESLKQKLEAITKASQSKQTVTAQKLLPASPVRKEVRYKVTAEAPRSPATVTPSPSMRDRKRKFVDDLGADELFDMLSP